MNASQPPIESPDVCARCAAQGTACCVSLEGVAGPPVTPGDIARISRATGLEPAQFVIAREVDAVEQQAWEEDDPATRGLVRESQVRSLVRVDHACIFLGPQGCTLGEARPLLCQRFPFVRVDEELLVKPGGICLAAEEAKSLNGLLTLLGTSRSRLKRIDRQLEQELR